MNISSLVLVFTSFISILVGSLVILRNYKNKLNISFFFFTMFAALWIFTNALFSYLSVKYAYSDALASYFFANATVNAFALFCIFYSNSRITYTHAFPLAFSIGTGFASLIPGVISTGVNQNYEIQTTSLLPVYGAGLVSPLLIGLWLLIRLLAEEKATTKARTRLIIVGLLTSSLFGLFFNFFLPLGGNYRYVDIGPAGVLFIILAIAVAIVRQRLFDIRPYIMRAVTYIYSLLLITLIYSFLIFAIAKLFGFYLSISRSETVIFIFSTFVAVFLFQPLRNVFESLTSKFFYKDFYDSQSILDRYGKIIVTNIEIEKLIGSTLQIIDETLHPKFVSVMYKYGDNFRSNDVGILKYESSKSIMHLVPQLAKYENYPISVDSYYTSDNLIEHLKKTNTSLVFLLKSHAQLVGFIFVGERLNGSVYSSKDTKLLSVISGELAIALQNALRFEEIANFNVTLQKKIEDATRELKRSNDKLQALDTAKDEFISMASHQLRTPLTSVKGYVSMVLDGDAGPITDQQRQLLQQSFLSSQRMVYLIADLLNVSRLRTGKFIIEAKPTYLPDVVESELEQLADTYKARGLNVVFNKPAKFPVLMLDETKIRQVIMNFTDNAIYYTPSGGRIEIVLRETAHAIEFDVNDSGIGVPKAEQHHLFTKFYRAHNAKRARPDGTGLGLFMAKKVIVAQGGSVVFRSTEGKGSTFGFTFPKQKLLVGAKPKK